VLDGVSLLLTRKLDGARICGEGGCDCVHAISSGGLYAITIVRSKYNHMRAALMSYTLVSARKCILWNAHNF
jgi:hypothetical protein